MYQCRVEEIFRKINERMIRCSSIFLGTNLTLIVTNIILRRIFNYTIFGITEIVAYLVLLTASTGLGQQEWVDNNIKMTALVESLRPRIQILFNTIVQVVSFIGFSVLSYYLAASALQRGLAGERTPALKLPYLLPFGYMALCFCWLSICQGVRAGLFLAGFIKYDDAKAAEILRKKPDNAPDADKAKPSEEVETV